MSFVFLDEVNCILKQLKDENHWTDEFIDENH